MSRKTEDNRVEVRVRPPYLFLCAACFIFAALLTDGNTGVEYIASAILTVCAIVFSALYLRRRHS
jgi:membrane protein implicated in regulation of membrane protease activity